MSAIPAHVAGFNKIIIVVSAPDVELTPVVLAAIAGVNKVTTVFGGQAIAALA
jgi:histidinol dehydrogenase